MIGITEPKTIYFIGIGGIGMAQAALLVQEMKHEVRGSDAFLYPPTDQLLKEGGIAVETGYDPAHLIPHPDLVVIGNAASRGNPEVEAVLDEGIPYVSLPELIREVLLRGKQSIVVTGTHGKTTTASLLAWLLFKGGLDPSFVVGGIPLNFGRGYRRGRSNWVVLEGDEYDSAFFDKRPKFLHYLPQVVILNNIEYDHADIYRDLEEVKLSFRRLLSIIPRKGLLVACSDDEVIKELLSQAPCRTETFGTEGTWFANKLGVTPKGTSFWLRRRGEEVGTFELPLWGEHNLRNALGALVTAHLIGISLSEIREGLRTFRGVRRRMEIVGEVQGVTVIDDFAHHPTAVRETLRAVRSRFPNGHVWAIFEPRTQTMRRGVLQGELALALGEADRVVIGKNVSPLIEAGMLDPQRLVSDISARGEVAAIYLEDPEEIVSHCVKGPESDDVIVVMSSGHFSGLPRRIFNALKNAPDTF